MTQGDVRAGCCAGARGKVVSGLEKNMRNSSSNKQGGGEGERNTPELRDGLGSWAFSRG